jgi:hypothetical protein
LRTYLLKSIAITGLEFSFDSVSELLRNECFYHSKMVNDERYDLKDLFIFVAENELFTVDNLAYLT